MHSRISAPAVGLDEGVALGGVHEGLGLDELFAPAQCKQRHLTRACRRMHAQLRTGIANAKHARAQHASPPRPPRRSALAHTQGNRALTSANCRAASAHHETSRPRDGQPKDAKVRSNSSVRARTRASDGRQCQLAPAAAYTQRKGRREGGADGGRRDAWTVYAGNWRARRRSGGARHRRAVYPGWQLVRAGARGGAHEHRRSDHCCC